MAQTDEATSQNQLVWSMSSSTWKDDFHGKEFSIVDRNGGTSRALTNDEYNKFIDRVKNGEAVAKAFKEFPYRGNGLTATVERELWYQEKDREVRADRKYVIVHIHFADEWDQNRHERRERQLVSGITQVNLRHLKSKPSEPGSRTEPGPRNWTSMFQYADPEPRGRQVFKFAGVGGWKWKEQPGAWPRQESVQVLMQNVNLNEPRHDDLIQWFEGDQPLARDSTRLQEEQKLEWSEKMCYFMHQVEDVMGRAETIFQAVLEQRCKPSRIGVEVLAIGNNAYDIPGIVVLENCVRDAHAVSLAFENIGARCHPVVENVVSPNQLTKCIEKWAVQCQSNEHGLRIVFLFWAGHSLSQVKGKKNPLYPFLLFSNQNCSKWL